MVDERVLKMPALSFSCENKKKAIINKECSQTIRPIRKKGYRIKVGDPLYFYWKQRVPLEKKDHHRLGEGIVSEAHYPMRFRRREGATGFQIVGNIPESIPILARKDGFETEKEFLNWFEDKYGNGRFDTDFKIIRWNWTEEGSS